MKNLIIILLFVFSTPLFATEDCVSFFESTGTHGPVKPPVSYPCRVYTNTGLPATIQQTEYTLYHFASGWTERSEDLLIMSMVSNAMHDSAQAMTKLIGLPPKKIKVLFTNDFANDTRWGDAGISGDTCYIRLFYGIGDGKEKTIKSVVAHEIHHCYFLENAFHNKPRKAFHAWIVEGLADFFMNVVYPDFNEEWVSAKLYDLDKPLTNQSESYSTNIFFQHLSNSGVSLSMIQLLLNDLADMTTLKDLQKKLKAFPDMANIFHKFAADFLLGVIRDTSGANVPVSVPAPDLNFTLKANENNLIEYQVQPFGVTTMRIKTPPNGKYTFKIDPAYYQAGFRISIKRQTMGGFMPVTPVKPHTIVADCDSEFKDIMVVATAVDEDAGSATPILRVDYEANDPGFECPCKKTDVPIDSCLKGVWIGDNRAYAEGLGHRLSRGGQAGMSNIVASGKYTMEFTDNTSGIAIADGQRIDADIELPEFIIRYSQVMNYRLGFGFSQQRTGAFCVDPRTLVGTATVTIDNDESVVDIGTMLTSLPGFSNTTEVTYRCRDDQLTLYIKDPSVDYDSYDEWIYHRKKN